MGLKVRNIICTEHDGVRHAVGVRLPLQRRETRHLALCGCRDNLPAPLVANSALLQVRIQQVLSLYAQSSLECVLAIVDARVDDFGISR